MKLTRKHLLGAGAALLIANEIRGVIVVVTIGLPILERMWR